MAYPDDLTNDSPSAGTTLLSANDHSERHNIIGSAVEALEQKVGLAAGTPTLNRVLTGTGNGSSTWGTQINNLNLGTPIIGTPSVTGGTVASALIGTSTIQGGTANNQVIGTPLIVGGTANNILASGLSILGNVLNNQGSVLIGFADTNGTTQNYIQLGNTVAGNAPYISAAGPTGNINLRLFAQSNGVVLAANALAPTVGTLSDSAGGTIAVNLSEANLFEISLGTTAGNRTIGTPTNPADGVSMSLRIKQNSNNTGTIVWPTGAFKFNENGTPALGTTSSWNYYSWRYRSADAIWHFQGNSNGIV